MNLYTVAHLCSMNQVLYDKLWGRSQRVVTLFPGLPSICGNSKENTNCVGIHTYICTIVRSTLHFLGIYPRTEQKVVVTSACVFITTKQSSHWRAYAVFLYLVVCDICSTHEKWSNIYCILICTHSCIHAMFHYLLVFDTSNRHEKCQQLTLHILLSIHITLLHTCNVPPPACV